MAACSLFEEDEVCHVTPDHTYIYGLVMENSESVSSDEEDTRNDVCKKGCVRVAWHPKGKESYDTPESKVLLADRSLVVSDIVRRFVPGQETHCGTVQDMQVTCHLHITGTDKYLYNVDSRKLSPCVYVQKFDTGYVTMDNWLGRVEEVTETITLQLPDGAKAKRKAEREAEVLVMTVQPVPRTTRAKEKKDTDVVRLQREKWAAYKRKERENWTSQRWRRHREKNLRAYHSRKETEKGEPPVQPDTSASHSERCPKSPPNPPNPTKTALRKAKYRIKKVLLAMGSRMQSINYFKLVGHKDQIPETPDSKRIKNNVQEKLNSLKRKRDKKSIAKRRLFLQTVEEGLVSPVTSPYKRKKEHKGTEAIKKFMEEQACHIPGKKNTTRNNKQKKILQKRLKHLHRDFRITYPDTPVSLRGMYRHRQDHILTSRHQKLRQCLCEICMNPDLKLDVLNRHLQQPVEGRDILSEMSVCVSPTLSCLERKCKKCGTDKVRPKLNVVCTTMDTIVRWQAWEMVKKGKGQRKEKVPHEGTLKDLIDQLLKEVEPLPNHIFTHRWQHKELKVLLSKLPILKDAAVVINDFAENYLCKYQDEVQSAHWGYNQVTVHPSVLYYPCACGELVTEYLVFLSDDLLHDAHLTRHITEQVKNHVQQKGFQKIIMWSDGCAAQYKSKLPFYFAAQSSLEWVFFGSRHGKSTCDACGGTVKTLCDDDVRSGTIIQNAQQMFDHLMKNHCLPENPPSDSECCHTMRSFRVVDEVRRNLSSSALNTVAGTRKIHHIKGQGGNSLLTRNFACFCDSCLGITDEVCTSSHFVSSWQQASISLNKSAAGPNNCGRTASPMIPPPELASREDVFKRMQQDMCAAATYDELYSVVERNMHTIQHYQVVAVSNLYITDIPSAQIDAQSLALRPEDAPCNVYPLCIYGDGNCFPRTLSVLAFGHQNNFAEMRVRLVAELVMNCTIYLSISYLAQGSTEAGSVLLRLLLRDVDIPDRNGLSSFEIFQHEILAICKPGADVNMWAVFAAANVLKAPVISVYPDKGQKEKKQLAKRKILPTEDTSHPGCHIMWTSARNDMVAEWWTANHFVPLLPMHSDEEPSVVEDTSQKELNTAFLDDSTSHLAVDPDRCQVDDSDVAYLDDITEKRPETATFNDEYWYPGQQLKGILGNLCNANWLRTSLLYNPRTVDCKRNSTFYSVVEKVEIRSIFVHWICRGYSKATISPGNKLAPPPKYVKGADIDRLQLIDWFEHCSVKLGDKVYYTIREEDVLETQQPKHHGAPHCVQQASKERVSEATHRTESLYRRHFDESSKSRRRASRKSGAVSSASASSSNATAATVNSSISNISTATTPDPAASEANESEVAPAEADQGAGDVEAAADADDEYEDVEDGKDDDSASDAASVSSSASGAKRRKRDKGVSVPVKSLRNASRHAKRSRQMAEIKVTPGIRVATEVCYTYSLVKVMWQDGTVEENIPSLDLFPVHHIDELEFFPGSFVIDASAPVGNNEYGVVTSCNHFERTCQVKWFKPYEVGQSACPTEVIKEAEMSVYDIHDHLDYKFRPGQSVIRVSGFEDTEQTLQAVGQVIRIDPDGTVFVHWSDNSFTSSYPQDLYIIWDLSDYSNSSWGSGDSSSSEEDTETDASWETEEEEEEWKVDGGGDGTQSEEEEWDSLKSMNEKRRSEIKALMVQIQNFFGVLNEFYTTLSMTAPDLLQNPSLVDSKLITCQKNVLKMYRSCRKLDKTLKTSYFSTQPIINLVTAIRFDMRKERTNKIKQHLDHIFESSNKTLLDKDSGAVPKTEAQDSADPSRRPENRLFSDVTTAASSSLGSPSKKMKTEDCGTSVDDEGSAVDLLPGAAQPMAPLSNGLPHSGVHDIERDISSRLAATNVAEKSDTVAAAAAPPPDEGVEPAMKMGYKYEPSAESDKYWERIPDSCFVAVNSLKKEEEGASVPDSQEQKPRRNSTTDYEKIAQLCVLFENTFASIQENVDKINAAMKGSRRNSSGLGNQPEEVADEVKSEPNEENGISIPEQTPCPSEKTEEKKVEEVGSLPPDTDVDMRADNQEACDTPIHSSHGSSNSPAPDSKEEEDGDIVDPPGVVLPKGYFSCNAAPDCHSYITKVCHPSNPKTFNSALRKELKLLTTSLPDGILVKGFDDRMDLFSVLIDGPLSTPYEDGMFLFDIMLPHDYPTSPPLFHYLSYCSDRLNPNLYADGKVCVSLLGTWSGKGMEVWTHKSNLLQVLVSIQGLILVDEPYYNEAGYEKQRGQQIALENSRMYNEMAVLKLVESMSALCSDLPKPFEEEVAEHLKNNGPRMIKRLRRWLSLSESMGTRQCLVANSNSAEGGAHGEVTTTAAAAASTHDSEKTGETKVNGATGLSAESSGLVPAPPQGHPHFPLLPMSKGFRLTLQKSLTNFEAALDKLGQESAVSENGAGTDATELEAATPLETSCNTPADSACS